ncbi:hypothetical protein W59_14971 [Rhodococcus opacus RKJ300 = JCM 13270]|uniref:Uncharacterized protein n=1 Tax=Rhodococcus opacus RKJ300 = JCM 13270 TaxID=1165867 RepID=I0WRX8_RHOOP|nr:hypothetical protein W59_14971 [Rhodococcus opacus RKJ300 = JCM 13270]
MWQSGGLDPADAATAGAVVAFGEQQVGEETLVGQLLLVGDGEHVLEPGAHRRSPQITAGLLDRGGGGFGGQSTSAPYGGRWRWGSARS